MATSLTRVGTSLTPFERLAARTRIPFWALCLALPLLMGFPAQYFSTYAATGSLDQAFKFTFMTGFSATTAVETPVVLGVASQVIYAASFGLVTYLPRFMRSKLESYEKDLAPLTPGGSESLRAMFGGIYRLKPMLIVSLIVGVAGAQYAYAILQTVPGPTMVVYVVVSNLVTDLVFGGFVWAYLGTLWALYRLGKEDLNLQPVERDPMLGMRPIGSMSFTLFLSYMAVITFIGIGSVLVPDPVSIGAIVLLELAGAVMLFLPLNSVHKKMLAKKRSERQKLAESIFSVSSGSDTNSLLNDIKQVHVFQVRREIVAAAPTWPFDTGVLGRFAAIILSVLAILLSRVISGTLHI